MLLNYNIYLYFCQFKLLNKVKKLGFSPCLSLAFVILRSFAKAILAVARQFWGVAFCGKTYDINLSRIISFSPLLVVKALLRQLRLPLV
jgi:hypothetical protein